jgi:hypothetical protein
VAIVDPPSHRIVYALDEVLSAIAVGVVMVHDAFSIVDAELELSRVIVADVSE